VLTVKEPLLAVLVVVHPGDVLRPEEGGAAGEAGLVQVLLHLHVARIRLHGVLHTDNVPLRHNPERCQSICLSVDLLSDKAMVINSKEEMQTNLSQNLPGVHLLTGCHVYLHSSLSARDCTSAHRHPIHMSSATSLA
jgi:hypothetical protein